MHHHHHPITGTEMGLNLLGAAWYAERKHRDHIFEAAASAQSYYEQTGLLTPNGQQAMIQAQWLRQQGHTPPWEGGGFALWLVSLLFLGPIVAVLGIWLSGESLSVDQSDPPLAGGVVAVGLVWLGVPMWNAVRKGDHGLAALIGVPLMMLTGWGGWHLLSALDHAGGEWAVAVALVLTLVATPILLFVGLTRWPAR